MIPRDVEVFLALEPVNTHLSFDRLVPTLDAATGLVSALTERGYSTRGG